MNTIYARNVPHAYTESIIRMKLWGVEEESRNGPVITSEDPVLLQISNPRERVLFDQTRDCNPFFHVMEVVWMLAGENDVRWIELFNRGFRNYADVGTDYLHGAYGHRWTNHFDVNQIQAVASLLKRDPGSRRAVIGMWDPRVDLADHADLPCNTSIMFRIISTDDIRQLDMTVINRSNDLIWGMLGANAVHMTYLHELMAFMTGTNIGLYKVFTNNLHVYQNTPYFEEVWDTLVEDDEYRHSSNITPYPLLQAGETYEMLQQDCHKLIRNRDDEYLETKWARHVAWPMQQAYMARVEKLNDGMALVKIIQATDWRLACEQYINRREKEKLK